MRNSLLIIILILVVLLQFLNQLFFELPMIVMAILIVLSFLIVEKKLLIGLYCFYIPISIPTILYIVNVVFVIALLFKFRHDMKIDSTVFYMLLISMFESIHVYINISNGKDESIINLLGFLLCIIPFIVINSISLKIDKFETLKLFFLGFFSFTIIMFGKYYVEFGTFNIFNNVQRFGFSANEGEISTNELLLNPNTIGVYSALIVAIIIVLQRFKMIKHYLIVWFMFSYAIIIGLLTVSRTFLLIITTLFFLYLLSSIMKKNVASFFVGMGIFLITLVVFLSNNQLSRMIQARLFESDDISGSRFSIYEEYLRVIFTNENIFLLGVGMQDYLEKVKNINYLINQSTHNMILETLVIWGIFGLIVVICLFISIIYKSKFWLDTRLSDSLIKLFPIIAVLLSAQFGQYFISFYHTFSITLLALIYLSVKEGVRNA